MLFNSLQFLFFFPIVVILYFAIPYSWRWLHLLIASCIFYMAFVPYYILILFLIIGIDYVMGILIEKSVKCQRKLYLAISLVANIGILFFFKYYNFFADNLNAIAGLLHWNYGLQALSIILPIGLSFHTFQAMSYTIEVYRGHQKAERHLGIYSLYVLFFPQMVAGPIERPQNLLPQFHAKHNFDYNKAVSGLRLILWGMFKKVVIADRLALVVNTVYSSPHDFTGASLVIAAYFFSFQIYCDFSGYSDIARGCARILGYDLITNFNFPYFAKSIREFWQRWHISLSTWFRDYLYIPLGGSKVGKNWFYLNILIVFAISGLWHGANWTFLIWGLLHGTYLIAATLFRSATRSKTIGALNTFVTFHFVTFAWIFFRAKSLSDAKYVTANLFKNPSSYSDFLHDLFGRYGTSVTRLGIDHMGFIVALASIVFLLIAEWAYKNKKFSFARAPTYIRWLTYYALIFLCLSFGQFGEQQFIYFQF